LRNAHRAQRSLRNLHRHLERPAFDRPASSLRTTMRDQVLPPDFPWDRERRRPLPWGPPQAGVLPLQHSARRSQPMRLRRTAAPPHRPI